MLKKFMLVLMTLAYAVFAFVCICVVALILSGGIGYALRMTIEFLTNEIWIGVIFALGAITVYLKYNPDMASLMGICIGLGLLTTIFAFYYSSKFHFSFYFPMAYLVCWPAIVGYLISKYPSFKAPLFDVDEIDLK